MNNIMEQIAAHQTKRAFTGEKLSQEEVRSLIEVGQRGATSQNLQSYSIISVTDPEKLQLLEEITGYNYIVNAGHFFLFIVDQYRNQQLIEKKNLNMLRTFDRFLGGVYDATIVAQNITLAAESMNLGTVYFGSILTDAKKIIEMFHLPPLTFPVFGLAVGKVTDKKKPIKPRVPLEAMHFENEYPNVESFAPAMEEYDKRVHQYYHGLGYDNVSNYTDFVAQIGPHSKESRKKLLGILKIQGFLEDEKA